MKYEKSSSCEGLYDTTLAIVSKPYLGGFRNKLTKREYHHATSQTDGRPLTKSKDLANCISQHVQTSVMVTKSSQMNTDKMTETITKKLNHGEKEKKFVVVTPKQYVSADQFLSKKYFKAIIIQKHWRAFLARQYVRSMELKDNDDNIDVSKTKELYMKKLAIPDIIDMERRLHPQSKKDFEVLYSELESWRREEISKIEAIFTSTVDEKKIIEKHILEKETKILRKIDMMKAEAKKLRKSKKIDKMLKLMALPKRWESSNGDITSVHTPCTIRAFQLKNLYENLNSCKIGVECRLKVLMRIKSVVKESYCVLTREISELVDREADLLNRGRSIKSLKGLRIRLKNLFLQYVTSPEFNPESNRFLIVPRDQKQECYLNCH